MTRAAAGLIWPAGLVLVLAYQMAQLVPPVAFAVLELAYVLGALALLRALGGSATSGVSALVLTGVGVFVLAGATGEPTAREPALMLLNAVVWAAAAVTLLVVAVGLALRCGAGRPAVLPRSVWSPS